MREREMKQTELFNPARTMPCPCPVGWCQAIRLPGQDRVITCAHDLNPEHRRRPRGCLNTYQQEHAEIPF